MKSAMKRAAGGVALTMVLIRGFCGGGVFLGYLGSERLLSPPSLTEIDCFCMYSRAIHVLTR